MSWLCSTNCRLGPGRPTPIREAVLKIVKCGQPVRLAIREVIAKYPLVEVGPRVVRTVY